MKTAITLLALLGLAGCGMSQRLAEQQAAKDDAQCRSYGAVPGEPAYVNCRAQVASSREAAGAIAGAVVISAPRQY